MTGQEAPIGGAVLPLVEGADNDPWRLLATQQGVVVSWHDAIGTPEDSWGPALRGTSALSRHLIDVVNQAGQSRLLDAGSTLFRVEVPTGSTLQDLVPAVGGGFRGMVRSAESVQVAGHARLIPVAAGAGSAMALGPLVGLMALSVGAEMLSRYQQDKKLNAIMRGVRQLNQDAEEKKRAELDSAEQALEQASAAILDRIEVPSAIGLGPARQALRVIRNQSLGWLDEWEDRFQVFTKAEKHVDFGDVRKALAGPDNSDDYLKFPSRVATLYRAIALDSRAIVLTGAEASLRRENADLGHLQEQLKAQLARNTEAQDRLRELLAQSISVPVTYSSPALPTTSGRVLHLQKVLNSLHVATSRFPEAPGVLNASNRQVTEFVRGRDGKLRIVDASKVV